MPYADLEQTFLTETHLKLNTWTRVRRTYRGHLLSFHLTQISLQKLIFATLTGHPSKFLICIENAKMKKLKTSVLAEYISLKTDNLSFFIFAFSMQIKNLDGGPVKVAKISFCREICFRGKLKR